MLVVTYMMKVYKAMNLNNANDVTRADLPSLWKKIIQWRLLK